ncbi:MAG TPA: hypothetical protein VLS48_03420 [Anaerolineales bacterium]|nr:hypothetical protein [Anaerolineales bacterium]
MAKNKKSSGRAVRSLRIQQIIFIVLGAIIILSMVIALIAPM